MLDRLDSRIGGFKHLIRKDGRTVKRLLALLIVAGLFLGVGIGCSETKKTEKGAAPAGGTTKN
jgi:hypothetical protein